MSGPDDRSTATIKFGKDFEAPWYVASGNVVTQRQQLVEFAGMEDNPELSLLDLMVLVASEAQAKWAIRSRLGAQPSSTEIDVPKKSKPATEKVASKPAEERAEADPSAFIFELIKEASDLKALAKVFLANKDAFNTNKALQGAFNARKAELS